jgi:hypothetical protein
MHTYFAFSDESGEYNSHPTENFLRKTPFFVRGTLLIRADEWIRLQNAFIGIKHKLGYPIDKEIKWSYLWSIYKHEKNHEPIPPNQDYSFLKGKKSSDILAFIDRSLQLLNFLTFSKIILTITDNKYSSSLPIRTIYTFHLQEIMQRIEMEIQSEGTSLCVLFIDPISTKVDQLLRNSYNDLFSKDEYINYKHIKDSLNLEYSHHSVGLQIADFISGCTIGWLKNFENSNELFKKYIFPNLRKNIDGEILGYGIREVPKNEILRNNLQTMVKIIN